MAEFIRTFRTTRRALGVSMVALVAASLAGCTRIDLRGPHGRLVLDPRPRRGRYGRRRRHDGEHHHDDDD